MRVQGGILPHAFRRLAGTAVCRRSFDRYDVEPVSHGLKRLMRKQRLGGFCGIFQEDVHLVSAVSLCKKGDVDATGGVLGRL